jgi:hypothetical protein
MYKIAHANLQKFMPSVCAKLYIEMRFRSHEALQKRSTAPTLLWDQSTSAIWVVEHCGQGPADVWSGSFASILGGVTERAAAFKASLCIRTNTKTQ